MPDPIKEFKAAEQGARDVAGAQGQSAEYWLSVLSEWLHWKIDRGELTPHDAGQIFDQWGVYISKGVPITEFPQYSNIKSYLRAKARAEEKTVEQAAKQAEELGEAEEAARIRAKGREEARYQARSAAFAAETTRGAEGERRLVPGIETPQITRAEYAGALEGLTPAARQHYEGQFGQFAGEYQSLFGEWWESLAEPRLRAAREEDRLSFADKATRALRARGRLGEELGLVPEESLPSAEEISSPEFIAKIQREHGGAKGLYLGQLAARAGEYSAFAPRIGERREREEKKEPVRKPPEFGEWVGKYPFLAEFEKKTARERGFYSSRFRPPTRFY